MSGDYQVLRSEEDASTALRLSCAALPSLTGRNLGHSSWFAVSQDRIDRFAAVTEDYQWIHVDRVRAAPQGGTLVHGFLTLALLPRLSSELLIVEDASHILNCGINRLRFTAPVRSGSRVRLRQTVIDVQQRAGGWQYVSDCAFEIEGQDRPACIVESVMLALP